METAKILIVVGPTASGKSELAVKLAKKFNGEIISADSRQIYRGLDIGSGKIEGRWESLTSIPGRAHPHSIPGRAQRDPGSLTGHPERSASGGESKDLKVFMYKGIPHHLIDEASPRRQYSVARFQKNAQKVIADIIKRGKLPIICGGTMHWLDAVVLNQTLPEVKPNPELRAELSLLNTSQMLEWLKRLDPERAQTIDSNNPRRLIRALEIVLITGQPVPKHLVLPSPHEGRVREGSYEALWLGLNPDQKNLDKKIKHRLKVRLKEGLIKEVENLHKQGLSWKKLESFGLEYKYCALHLQGKLEYEDMEAQLFTAIRQYSKRQLTWWKRNQDIHWSDEPQGLLALAKKRLS